MGDKPMQILKLNTFDIGGGAEKVAWDLLQAYQAKGHYVSLAVGRKRRMSAASIVIPNKQARFLLTRFLLRISQRLKLINTHLRGAWRMSRIIDCAARPRREWELARCREDFHYPGTWRLLKLNCETPDILHCHNLHGDYFDLRALPWLSRQLPVVLTLHDAWLLSGHCAHSFCCDRWQSGCGACPDLTIYPSIQKDSTAYNWRRKQKIYARSRLYVATPSHWLMAKVKQSMLASAIVEAKIIPNGVNLSIFRPAANRMQIRTQLGIPQAASIILFTANGIRQNIWKDYQTIRATITLVEKGCRNREIIFLGLGDEAPPEFIGSAKLRFIPYKKDPATVACYYQAADVYLHASKADTFPNTILEALACGIPVVATGVGGIPEQIKGLGLGYWNQGQKDTNSNTLSSVPLNDATGALVPPGDAESMAKTLTILLNDGNMRLQLGENAACDAQQRFDLKRQANTYLKWYRHILAHAPYDNSKALGHSGYH